MEFQKIDVDYNPEQNDRFNGIIQFLTNKFYNIEEVVCAESSSIYSDPISFAAASALHLKKRCMMHTNSEKDAFLLYDFIDRRIRPKYYSIKAKTNNSSHFLRSWNILGSNDKLTWDVLDERPDDESLCGIGSSNTFKIEKDLNENQCYRYLKLIQTEVSSSCQYYLALTSLEFFGTIYEPI